MREPGTEAMWRRFVLALARAVLGLVARVAPASGWARLYRRLRFHRDGTRPPRDPARRRHEAHVALFVVLVSAAAVFWLLDLWRHRPRPEPVPPAVTRVLPGAVR